MSKKKNIYNTYLSTHPTYSDNQHDYTSSFRIFRANFLAFLPSKKDARILDIGCGNGHFLSFLEHEKYKNFLGIDISKDQIEYCKSHVTKKVQLITDLMVFLEKSKNQFDFILLNDVIEHLEKDEIVPILSVLLDSLTQNGIVVIRTVNLKNRWGMTVRYMDFTHTVGFTEESIKQIMLTAGFIHIRLYKEVHPIHDMKSFVRVVLKSFFELIYRLEYLASFGGVNPMLSNMLIVVGKKLS